jgi:hypothetical protein
MQTQRLMRTYVVIDEPVTQIAELLNTVPGLSVVASSRGDGTEAHVCFQFGGLHSILSFLFEVIEPVLRPFGKATVSIETLNGRDPIGKIKFRPQDGDTVFSALQTALSKRIVFQCFCAELAPGVYSSLEPITEVEVRADGFESGNTRPATPTQ